MGHTDLGRRQLWNRCRQLAATLALPVPFEASALADTLSVRLGRPVELLPMPSQRCSPCGMLVTTDRAEYIGYPTDTSPLHQQHIVLHEVGHLLCGHHGTAVLGPAATEALLPHLSGELIRRVLGRSVYSDVQEQEAELFASLVPHHAARGQAQSPPADAAAAETAARLGSLFGRPSQRPGSRPDA